MNWYKKDTRPNLLIAHGENQGHVFAQLLKNSLSNHDFAINLISSSRAHNFEPSYSQSMVCVDAESAIAFSHVKGNVLVFPQSPYEIIENEDISVEEKKKKFLGLHNSLSKAKRVIALSEGCRMEIQQFHSKHIFLCHLPSTQNEIISSLPVEGIAIIVNEVDLGKVQYMLENLQQFNPVLYVNPASKRTITTKLGMRLPMGGLVPVRPAVQIYLGIDRSECSPLRIIDASAAGSVVVQIAHEGLSQGSGRWMPTDCIGYFNLEKSDSDTAEVNAFISHVLTNHMFFDSILSAQRRYMPNYQSNRNAFFELLTK